MTTLQARGGSAPPPHVSHFRQSAPVRSPAVRQRRRTASGSTDNEFGFRLQAHLPFIIIQFPPKFPTHPGHTRARLATYAEGENRNEPLNQAGFAGEWSGKPDAAEGALP